MINLVLLLLLLLLYLIRIFSHFIKKNINKFFLYSYIKFPFMFPFLRNSLKDVISTKHYFNGANFGESFAKI